MKGVVQGLLPIKPRAWIFPMILLTGVGHATEVIKGISAEKCVGDVEDLKSDLVDRIGSDSTLCDSGYAANQLGGWTCQQTGKRSAACRSGHYRCNTQYLCVEQMEATPSAAEPLQPAAEAEEEPPREAAKNLPVECPELPDKLESCEPYHCKFTHPFSGTQMEKRIVGKKDQNCEYHEEMPNNGKMTCHYPPDYLQPVAGQLRALASGKEIKSKVTLSGGGAKTSDEVDGKEVKNYLSEAMKNGICEVSGY